jgi:hypothetical protein
MSKISFRRGLGIIGLFVLVLVVAIACQHHPAAILSETAAPDVPATVAPGSAPGAATHPARRDVTDITTDPISVPTVQFDRLWADVEALSFERFTEGDRQQAREYLRDALTNAGFVPIDQPFEGGVNILASKPGTDLSAGSLLLGAHYDTVEQSPGADDNASAVAAVLELARLFAQMPTPLTLEIALFDQEEVGLVGSEFLATQRAIANPPLRGSVILEMLGYACHEPGCQRYPNLLPNPPNTNVGNFLAAIADQDHQFLLTPFRQSGELPVFTLTVPQLGPFTPDLLRSDHASFWRKGIGAVMVTDTADFRNPHYHQPDDFPQTLDQEFYRKSVQLIANALLQLLQASGEASISSLNLSH